MENHKDQQIKIQQLSEDLEDLETYLNEFNTFLPLPVCSLNPIGIIIDINKAFKNLTNYDSLEIFNRPIQEFFKENINDLLKDVQIKGQKTKELTLISKDKKEILVNTSFSIRKDKEGNFIGYFVGFSDITELKRLQEDLEKKVKERTKELERVTEERTIALIREQALVKDLAQKAKELEESRAALMDTLKDIEEARMVAEEEKIKTQTIITNLTDGLLVFNQENNVSLINPQAEKFFNIKAEEVIGKAILELTNFQNFIPLINIIGVEIKGVFRKELPINENFTLEVSTIPLMQGEKKLGNLVILHDVTREKIVERMKTEFVSIAAHQLRTPLSAIKWTLGMFLDGDVGEITSQQRELLEKTYKSNERIITLINDLLDVTRIEEGRYLYKLTLCDFESIVQSAADSYKDEIQRKKIIFGIIKPKKRLPSVTLDVEKMTLAIQNLIDNAIKYTPPGGSVTIFLEADKDEIKFSIHDTGIGISKDEQERIFTRFFRGVNALRMETDGTGLGLFISKNIIEAHGGKIWFESEEGKGTIFYFTIPVKSSFE